MNHTLGSIWTKTYVTISSYSTEALLNNYHYDSGDSFVDQAASLYLGVTVPVGAFFGTLGGMAAGGGVVKDQNVLVKLIAGPPLIVVGGFGGMVLGGIAAPLSPLLIPFVVE